MKCNGKNCNLWQNIKKKFILQESTKCRLIFSRLITAIDVQINTKTFKVLKTLKVELSGTKLRDSIFLNIYSRES